MVPEARQDPDEHLLVYVPEARQDPDELFFWTHGPTDDTQNRLGSYVTLGDRHIMI